MPPNPPQTLSVKRKRHELPVDSLVVDFGEKRQKSETFAWRLVQKPGIQSPPPPPSPAQSDRRFHFSYTSGNRVLVEGKVPTNGQDAATSTRDALLSVPEARTPESGSIVAQEGTPRPRKRPGAGSALHPSSLGVKETAESTGPSEEDVRRFEQLAEEVEKDELAKSRPPASPLKYKPKVPALRYKERHPEKAAVLAQHDPDAMDVDDYVYDTYVREVIMPNADGKIPEPQGTVGIIVLNEEDEDWWNGDNDSDREFATDDEDENAEDYYANDYPEDEMSSDDEYDRNLYQRKYRHGSDDEEYNLEEGEDDDARSGDEDDEHFRRVGPQLRPGYWGRFGE